MKNSILMTEVSLKEAVKNLYKQGLLDLDKTVELGELLLTKQFILFVLTLNMYGFTLEHINGSLIDYNKKSLVNVIQREKYYELQ